MQITQYKHKRPLIKRLAGCVAAALVGATLAGTAAAQQDFPSRAIQYIYPYAAGSSSDAAYRFVVNEAVKMTGKQIIFDNKPGGNGRVGFNLMTNSKPDGYTVCLITQGIVILDGLADPSLRIEPVKDYVPVNQFVESTLIMSANPGVPFKDMPSLLQYAKANPGKLNVGVVGGSGGPIALALLKLNTGIDVVQVRFKGDAPGLQELVAGRIELMIGVSGSYRTLKDAGKVIGIASLGQRRSGAASEVPTAVEQGTQVSVPNWAGVAAPPGTPADVLNKLSAMFNQALALPDSKQRMGIAGLDVVSSSPDQFLTFIRSENERITSVVKRSGIKLSD